MDLAKKFKDLPVHPFYVSIKTTAMDMLNDIKRYQPKQSLMELKELPNLERSQKLQKSIGFLKKQKQQILLKGPAERGTYQKEVLVKKVEPIAKSTFLISNAPRPERILKIVKKDRIEEEDLDRVKVDAFDRQLLKRQKILWNDKKKNFRKILVDENDQSFKTGKSLMDTDGLKKKFYQWKRQSGVKLQREGQLLDQNQAKVFREKFLDRKKNKFHT